MTTRAVSSGVALLTALVSIPALAGGHRPGYDRLVAEFGDRVPDGRRIEVAQVEPPSPLIGDDEDASRRSHIPGRHRPEFRGVTFLNVADNALDDSSHATTTGRALYGRGTSVAPGVNRVHLYTANEFLRGLGRPSGLGPARVWNHSWIGGLPEQDGRVLRALDSAVVRRGWVVTCGIANNPRKRNPPLLASAFNVLAVGRSDGNHSTRLSAVDGPYEATVHRPHLVASASKTSEAAPRVGSVATLLLDALVADPVPGRRPDDDARIVRAALMAGADRRLKRAEGAPSGPPERLDVNTPNGLNAQFGAGELNVYESGRIVLTGAAEPVPERDATWQSVESSGYWHARRVGQVGGTGLASRLALTPPRAGTLTVALIWDWSPARRNHPSDLSLAVFTGESEPRLIQRVDGHADTGEHLQIAIADGERIDVVVGAARPHDARTPFAVAWRVSD
ncbi:MAG: hypothetical protein AAF610_01485 [Pseudomonadota bacterium]